MFASSFTREGTVRDREVVKGEAGGVVPNGTDG